MSPMNAAFSVFENCDIWDFLFKVKHIFLNKPISLLLFDSIFESSHCKQNVYNLQYESIYMIMHYSHKQFKRWT